ncbi:amino acid ABC transporter substrate-binding protein [uncultured Planktomarina sp.]|jgi:branched-chain amino acid transport system substrate-binding protein|uniref:amino acid ABC transporter substrate-binding protein n=1 Tax=uncultured Planktomarina sp. TaxID=1538529 RepID=UPI003260F1C0|nr:amino acid ABC transporter substrate-binding protein [Planktomarina temperata]|tara:strand:+ start:326 stop:1534 length:1209 start_codon:yes stop_codon:yes gene_type:complete
MIIRNILKTTLAAAFATSVVMATAVSADGVIKLGAIAPKTGPLAGGAVVTQWPNVDLWVTQVNARGGLNVNGEKMTIELIQYDDKTNPGEHIKLAQRLAEQDKVDFVVAPYGTGFNIATAPIYGRYGYPMIAVSAITDKAEELTERYPNLFFTLGTTTAFVEGVREILIEQRAAGEIGNEVAMVNVADAFGIELADRAREMFSEAGFELVYDKSYPLGTPDLSPVMKGAKASGAKAFVAWSYPPDSFGLAEQAIIEDLDVAVYYSAVATSFPAFSGAYGNKINNVLGAGGTNVDDPQVAEYRQAHLDITGKTADYWASANTYASLQILEQSIEGAGSIDRDVVTQYIKDNSFETVMGTLSFENNISSTFWSVGQWQDGVFRGVKGNDVDGAVGVRVKDGWAD